MMSSISERIYTKTNSLVKEKEEMYIQINKLKQTIEAAKRGMHRTELEIAAEAASGLTGSFVDLRLSSELRELKNERNDLHTHEKALNDLTAKYKDLIKKIEDHRFWMRWGDTTDIVRQREAEKKIFG